MLRFPGLPVRKSASEELKNLCKAASIQRKNLPLISTPSKNTLKRLKAICIGTGLTWNSILPKNTEILKMASQTQAMDKLGV